MRLEAESKCSAAYHQFLLQQVKECLQLAIIISREAVKAATAFYR